MTPDDPSRINPYVPSGAHIAGVPPVDPEHAARADDSHEVSGEPRPLNAAREPDPWARWMNLALGLWLVISAFAWTHGDASFTNTWVLGALIAVAAAAALMYEPIRWVTAALAVWLFFSTFAFAERPATLWHNAIVAVVVFLCALVPGSLRTFSGRPHDIARATL